MDVPVEEFSPGGYRVDCRDLEGRSVSLTGDDPEKLLDDARAWAVENADLPPRPGEQAEIALGWASDPE